MCLLLGRRPGVRAHGGSLPFQRLLATRARTRSLAALATREGEAWREVEALIASKQPRKYEEAVVLLRDLRDVCALAGRQAEAAGRIARLREEHARKPSLVERLRKAGLFT